MVKTIMVVDDEPGVIYTIKQGLEHADPEYRVITANSGKQCLELLGMSPTPDLILLDIMMPEMSGWETLKKIKENSSWNDISIVFLTARTDPYAKNAGGFLADDYIEKPFEIHELKKRIDGILDEKGNNKLM